MNRSIVPREFSISDSDSLPIAEKSGHRYPRPLNHLKGRGRDYQCVMTFAPVRKLPTRPAPPPPEVEQVELEAPRPPRPSLWNQFLAFLNGGSPKSKQLHLAETVALGEKRFVAIIHAEGHKYLVGGGTSGVHLLTQLDSSTRSIENLPTFRESLEAAG